MKPGDLSFLEPAFIRPLWALMESIIDHVGEKHSTMQRLFDLDNIGR